MTGITIFYGDNIIRYVVNIKKGLRPYFKQLPDNYQAKFELNLMSKFSNFIINKSPLMKTLKSNKDKYEIKSVDAIVSDEYIIPGIEGKKVSEIESYYNMKKYNTFVSDKLIYKSIIPSISLEKNKDLIINKANPLKKGVSLLVSNNKGVITYSKTLDITLLVNDETFKGNILNEQINDGKNFNKTNDILNKYNKNKKICIINKYQNDECYKKGYYLVKPTYEINNNNIYIKDKITSGDIILISDDLKVEYYKEILKTLNYKDLKVYKLSYLISEKRD